MKSEKIERESWKFDGKEQVVLEKKTFENITVRKKGATRFR